MSQLCEMSQEPWGTFIFLCFFFFIFFSCLLAGCLKDMKDINEIWQEFMSRTRKRDIN